MKTNFKNYRCQISGLVVMLFLFSQCSVIKPGYNGVLDRSLGDGIKIGKVYKDGFTWIAPWNTMVKINVQYQSYTERIAILTSDELHTIIDVSAILRPTQEELPNLILDIGKDYYARVIRPEFFSVTRNVMSQYEYSSLSAKSSEMEKKMLEELKLRLAGKHIELIGVTLDHIMYSKAVTEATDRKLSTKQEIEQKGFEQEIAEKEAEIQRIKAKGQRDAQKIIDEGLTHNYLQFKALEVQDKLSNSNNAKFFFVPIGKDGLPIIVDASEDK
ncbi:MAG: prohibitin family protein [Prolixibacteraceae bacterium]